MKTNSIRDQLKDVFIRNGIDSETACNIADDLGFDDAFGDLKITLKALVVAGEMERAKKVVVEVFGCVAEVTKRSANVNVEIMDHDNKLAAIVKCKNCKEPMWKNESGHNQDICDACVSWGHHLAEREGYENL